MPDPRTPIDDHPELDPAEGSREVIDKDLAQQSAEEARSGRDGAADKKDGAKNGS